MELEERKLVVLRVKDVDQSRESVKVQQRHREASIPGTEPGTCLSTAFTNKLLCCFC